MVTPELLEILVCPVSHQALHTATESELAPLNDRIRRGACRNLGGEKIVEAVESGLLREDGEVLYRVRGGIPVLISSEGILVSG
jgi:uncharacterized protein YbaR (Trm112 family)